MTRSAAVKALSNLALNVTISEENYDYDRESPPVPLPLCQQRVNYFS